MKTPLSNELLKNFRNNNFSNNDLNSVYYHLFSCMDIERLEKELEYALELSQGKDSYFKEDGKENWFYIFHKSMRQTDFFDEIYREKENEFTKDEKSRLRFLRETCKAEGYVKESEVKGELFTKEYTEYLALAEKWRRRKETVSLGGHLDMILWNMIHVDTKEVLVNALKFLFEDFKDGFVK